MPGVASHGISPVGDPSRPAAPQDSPRSTPESQEMPPPLPRRQPAPPGSGLGSELETFGWFAPEPEDASGVPDATPGARAVVGNLPEPGSHPVGGQHGGPSAFGEPPSAAAPGPIGRHQPVQPPLAGSETAHLPQTARPATPDDPPTVTLPISSPAGSGVPYQPGTPPPGVSAPEYGFSPVPPGHSAQHGQPSGNLGQAGFPLGPPGGPPPGTGPGRQPGRQRPKWLVPAIAGAAATALLLTVTGGAVVFAGEVPRGTTVLGVDIGGRTQAEAATALKDGLGKRVAQPVSVRINDADATIDPKQVGLAIDHEATARRAVQSWPNPFTVLFGEREVDPVVKVDTAKLDDVLQKLGASATEKLARPAIRYQGLTPKPIYPESGKGLDPDRSAGAFRGGWLRGPVVVPIVSIEAVTTKDDVDKLLTELARPAVAAPVVVSTPRGDFTITRQAIAKSLLMESNRRGEIVPKVDPKRLRAAARAELARVEVPAKDAKPAMQAGKLVVAAEATGKAVDLRKLAKVLLPILRQPAPRKVPGALVTKKPKLTREKISKLGIKEKISTFTTHFTGGQDRNKNILVVADEVDNALVLPGKTFSLNGYTGERSYAQGYVDAPVILDGKIQNYVGGGISQFATTLFNAGYYAGLEDVYHQPHGYYISRYPSVIEATVFYPSLDLKFKNDSRYGVLIDTSYTDTSITVTMWSTKRYLIKTTWGPKTDPKQPVTKHLTGKGCIPTEGIPGFSQEAWRLFHVDGKEIKRERFFWRYKAEPRFVCDPPESPAPG